MIGYIIIAALVAAWIWIAYEYNRAPFMNEDDDIDDPTTTCWHDDEIKN